MALSWSERACVLAVALLILGTVTVSAAPETTVPFPGIREHTPQVHALTNARIVTMPGTVIENGTLIVRDGMIEAVGPGLAIPADARVWDMAGKTIYPGLIDAFSELPSGEDTGGGRRGRGRSEPGPGTPEPGGARYWNDDIVPQTAAGRDYKPVEKTNEAYRSQGVTARLVAPSKGIIKGTSAVVTTGDGDGTAAILRDDAALHLMLTTERGWGDRDYPNSPMGAMSLVRQAFYDADWYKRAHAAYAKNPSLGRPERNDALDVLGRYAGGSAPVMIETSDEMFALRAEQVAKELGLNLILRGSGREYRLLNQVKAIGSPVIVPLNFPEAPGVKSPEQALSVTLETLMHWDIAPENPARLAGAGVPIAFTTDGLDDVKGFLGAIRKAVKRGLSADDALRALTTTPANLLGVSERRGAIAQGKAADFVVADGDLFAEKTEVLETWVDGLRYEIKSEPLVDARGTWSLQFSEKQPSPDMKLALKGEAKSPKGEITFDSAEIKLSDVDLVEARLTFGFEGDTLGAKGVVQVSVTVSGETMLGDGYWPDGKRFTVSARRTEPFVVEADSAKPEEGKPASFPVNYPLGAFGVSGPPAQPATVLFRNATVWTCNAAGDKLEKASVLVRQGKIAAVGTDIAAPADAVVVDLSGKHLAPGVIDCHSHTATDGGINESGQTITAEVRIADFIDYSDINIYRQLAGGVTAINILHGSANTIGGQNQVIKMRWGSPPEDLKFKAVPAGIKFALGENVKQANWGDEFTTRYPQTRMGVEQIVRDEFEAARSYKARWAAWNKSKKGMPPRRDLELDAIVEILDGQRFIHCHSYRQDEILALIRTCADYGVEFATFQHILEGYKVADAMAENHWGGSSFSDWWAYKIEVWDAIPYNGALMHNAGVVVSFNSDSGELARRLNTEAAKAVKYGGVPETEALKFVTLNAAKQLRVDPYVGSIEIGKDADLSVWNESPLSTFAYCEQTWIDGRKYFDRTTDAEMRRTNESMRSELIQKILSEGKGDGGGKAGKGRGRKWPNCDIYCGHCRELHQQHTVEGR